MKTPVTIFEIVNKRILIQQRALACLSKSLAHIVQRELYTMGNTGLLRREAEMTLLQQHLGDSRCQELRNSPFWPTPLFRSQLVKDGEDFLLKKAPPKILRVLDPKTSPFVVPTTIRKEAPTGNTPMSAIPPKAVINRFPQVGGNRTTEASEVIFNPIQGDKGMETFPTNDSLQAFLSQPVGGRLCSFRRDWLAIKCSDVKHFSHQWLHSSIHLKTQFSQSSPNSIGLQDPSKGPSSGLFYQVSSVKERNRKGGKCKISRVLQSPISSTQASPKVEASNRPKQAQHLHLKMETPESIRTSLIQGEWMSSIDLSDTYFHIPIHPNSRKYLRFCHKSWMFQFTSFPFGLATAPPVFTMIVKEVKLMALTRRIRLHQYLDD